MNLDMEVLDPVEAPLTFWEGVALVAGALGAGLLIGAGVAAILT